MIEQDFMGWLTEAMSAPSPIDELRGLTRYRGVDEVCDQAIAALSLSVSRHEHQADQGVALLFMMSAVVFLDIKRAAALVASLSEELSASLQAAQLPRLEAVFARATFKALREGSPFEPESLFEEHQYLSEQYLRLSQGGHTNALSLLCANMLDAFALDATSITEQALSGVESQLNLSTAVTGQALDSADTQGISLDAIQAAERELSDDDETSITPEGARVTEHDVTHITPQQPVAIVAPAVRLAQSPIHHPAPQSPFTERLQMNTAELEFVKKESLALEAVRLAEEAQAHALAAQHEAERTLREAQEAKLRAEARAQSTSLHQHHQASPAPFAQAIPSHQPALHTSAEPSLPSPSQLLPPAQAQHFSAAHEPQLPFSQLSGGPISQHVGDGVSSDLPSMMLRRLKPKPSILATLIVTQAVAGLMTLIFSFQIGVHFMWLGPLLMLSALFMFQGKRSGWTLSIFATLCHGLYLIVRLQSGDFHIYLKSPALYLVSLGMFGLSASLLSAPVRSYFKTSRRF